MSPIEVSNYFSVDEWQANQLKVEDVSECESYQSFSPWKQLYLVVENIHTANSYTD